MATYTLSMDYIEGVNGNESQLHNVFMKFPNPDCEHKAAMDRTKKLLHIYTRAARSNIDVNTWLDWMTRKPETGFELININVPDNIEEEEIYLMVAAATMPYKKVIVNSHQCWSKFDYECESNRILYNGKYVTILDKQEAYKEINKPEQKNEIAMTQNNNPWRAGLFYLTAITVIIGITLYAATKIPITSICSILLLCILIVITLGALQLKNDQQIEDKTFLEIVKLSLAKFALFKNMTKK